MLGYAKGRAKKDSEHMTEKMMPFLEVWKLKIKKVIVFTFLICAKVVLMVTGKDFGVRIQI